MAKRRRDGSISFPDMVAFGENENRFTAHTTNGTVHGDEGPGPQQPKYNLKSDGERWAWPDDKDETFMPMVRTARNRKR